MLWAVFAPKLVFESAFFLVHAAVSLVILFVHGRERWMDGYVTSNDGPDGGTIYKFWVGDRIGELEAEIEKKKSN